MTVSTGALQGVTVSTGALGGGDSIFLREVFKKMQGERALQAVCPEERAGGGTLVPHPHGMLRYKGLLLHLHKMTGVHRGHAWGSGDHGTAQAQSGCKEGS